MTAISPSRPRRYPTALNDNGLRRTEHRFRSVGLRRPNSALGMEALDLLGIDIDQDPRAFAKFLELRNLS
jgi:hypothetical protein